MASVTDATDPRAIADAAAARGITKSYEVVAFTLGFTHAESTKREAKLKAEISQLKAQLKLKEKPGIVVPDPEANAAKIDYRDFNEETSAALAISRLRQCKNERLKKCLASIIAHAHACVKDMQPTEDEWLSCIEYLTSVGHMCTSTRQEFVLLSDVLGISSLVEQIVHRKPTGASSSTVLGPFHLAGSKLMPMGASIAQNMKDGQEVVRYSGRILDVSGKPVSGAVLDVWHADNEGFYDIQKPDANNNYRGKFQTGKDGAYNFKSIMMKFYPIPNDGPVGKLLRTIGHHPYRPAHLHVIIAAPGYEVLTTHLFPSTDPYIDNDVVFGVKKDLVKEFRRHADHWAVEHDFVLSATTTTDTSTHTTFDPLTFVPRGSASNFGKK